MAVGRGIGTKSIYDKETPGEGLKLLIMRRWPRGVSKKRIDEWDKDLAPSPGLLNDWIKKKIPFKEFRRKYLSEMRTQKDKVKVLAGRAKKETITLFCHEEEDTYCHRKMLKELIDKCR
ncbi:MAG: DUF488 family protein [Candidatus Brocadiales bacterium]|nr:DUF488 family protein [Candidatus Bathyanammoxibius amoris]